MTYVQGESLKVIVPFLNGFELPAALVVSVANAFKSIQVTTMDYKYSPIQIEMCNDFPEQALEKCCALLEMVSGLMTGNEPLGGLGNDGACGLQWILDAISKTNADVQKAIYGQRKAGELVTPSLTEPRKGKAARAQSVA